VKFRTPRTLRAALEELGRIRRDHHLVLWSLIVILIPFYFFDSGLPQPADCLSLVLLLLLVRSWNGRLPGRFVRPLKLLMAFIVYVFLVNAGWSVAMLTFTTNAKEGFLLAPTFYVFNGLMFFTFFLMFQRYGEFLLWLTVRLVLTSVLLQVVLATGLRRVSGRSTVMFNNPNQLGYYALLSACILLLGQKRLRLSTVQVTVGLAACSYLALLSASKAALASIAALGIAVLISKFRTIVVAGLVFAILIFTNNPFSTAIERAQRRIDNDQSLEFLEERGYDRIGQYPDYWILGSGEGAYNRYKETSAIGSHELHSSMATLFFCYGVIGTVIFALFLWGTIARTGIRAWIIVGAGLAYGLTHQGLRFRLLWLLLGMVCALRELEARDRAAAPPRRALV
jgi:O-antigen ligase